MRFRGVSKKRKDRSSRKALSLSVLVFDAQTWPCPQAPAVGFSEVIVESQEHLDATAALPPKQVRLLHSSGAVSTCTPLQGPKRTQKPPQKSHEQHQRLFHESQGITEKNKSSVLIRLPLPQCFCPHRRKLRPWSEKNSDQNSDHPRLCIYWGKDKLRPWSKFLGSENSDHGLSFGCFCGRGSRGSSPEYCPPIWIAILWVKYWQLQKFPRCKPSCSHVTWAEMA